MNRKDEIKKLQDSLQKRRASLISALKQEPMTSRTVMSDDLSSEAQATELLEVEAGINAVESQRLIEINEALDKMKKGIYGVCEECKQEISIGRLQAIPHAARCIRCQAEEEANN